MAPQEASGESDASVAAAPSAHAPEPPPPPPPQVPTPPPPLRFAAHRLPARFGSASAYEADGWLVLATAGELAIFEDPRAAGPARTVRNPFRREASWAAWMGAAGGHEALGHDGSRVVLLDLGTGRVRWRAPLPGLVVEEPLSITTSATTLAAEVAREPDADSDPRAPRRSVSARPVYLAFDRATGAERWRAYADSSCGDGATSSVYLASTPERLEARDLETGRARWARRFGAAEGFAPQLCGGPTLVTRRHAGIAGIDTDGALRWDERLGYFTPESFVRSGDDVCFALYARVFPRGLRVECHRISDGALRWRRDVVREGPMPAVHMRAAGGRLVLVGADGVLRVLDAATGVERWHWGLGAVRPFAVADEGRVLVATDVLGRAWRFVETDDEREAAPEENARVELRIVPRAGFEPLRQPVLLNGVALALPEGAEAQRAVISTSVATRGVLEVFAYGDSTANGTYEGRTLVTLDGRARPYAVRVRMYEAMSLGE